MGSYCIQNENYLKRKHIVDTEVVNDVTRLRQDVSKRMLLHEKPLSAVH